MAERRASPGERSFRRVTPPGRAAIAALAVRGPGLAEWLGALLAPAPRGRGPALVRVLDAAGDPIDEAIWVPLAPDEGLLTLHGNPLLVDAVAARLAELGAAEIPAGIERWAEAGRPLSAEALRLLAAAPTPAGALFLIEQAERLAAWSARGAADPRSIASGDIRAALGRRRAAAPFVSPPRIVLAGVPNAGKSTLYNRLLGRERVVVAATPGTTRDRIEERGVVADRPVVWIDGAGIRDEGDEIEREGVRRMRDAVARADLVILLVPPGGAEPALPAGPPLLRIRSKADSIPAATGAAEEPLAVSGLTGEGVESLLDAIAEGILGGAELPAEPTPLAERHAEVLADVLRRREAREDERLAWRSLAAGEEGTWSGDDI